MLGFMRNKKRTVQGVTTSQHKPRTIPEDIFMWGGSFWEAWKQQASPLAQKQLDQIVSQLRRSTRTSELRFHRHGSILSIQAGTRCLRIEMIWSEGQVVEVVNLTQKSHHAKDALRTHSL